MIAMVAGALLIGITLGILGSGGSIITVPLLIYGLGEEPKLAIAESLIIVGLIAVAGTWRYHRKRLVAWSLVWRFGLPGMAGTYFGAWLSQYLTADAQMLLFAGIMLLASRQMLKPVKAKHATGVPPLVVIPAALMVGALAGLVGVGGGFLIVPALVLIFGMPMTRAVGTSLSIIFLQSAAGAGKYLYLFSQADVTLNWQLVLLMAAIGAAGSVVGSLFAERLPQGALKKTFGYVLVLIAAFIIVQHLWPAGH